VGKPIRSWQGLRPALSGGGDNRSVTVTFDYAGELRTVVARNRKEAFAEASSKWGWGWDGESCVSTPETIFNDPTGWTKATHGQDFHVGVHSAEKRDEFRRSGQPYA
jgi:hypothetical protein